MKTQNSAKNLGDVPTNTRETALAADNRELTFAISLATWNIALLVSSRFHKLSQ
jgi:hypothetical protein